MTKNTLTYLYNKMWENIEKQKLQLEMQKLMETIRNNNIVNAINKEKNRITKLANDQLNAREISKLGETIRHNVETELETNRANMSNEDIKRVQNAISKYDAETRRLDYELRKSELPIKQQTADTQSKQASTSEKKLVTDFMSSVLKGAGIVAIGKVISGIKDVAVAKQFQTAMSGVEKAPGLLAGFTSAVAGLPDKLTTLVTQVSPVLKKGVSTPAFAAINGLILGSMASETKIANPEGSSEWQERVRKGINNINDVPEDTSNSKGPSSNINNYKGEINDEKKSEQTQTNVAFRYPNTKQESSSTDNSEPRSSGTQSATIWSGNSKEKSYYGPGFN